jgi:predicted transcriptional regulator of viral defense system
MPEVGHERKEGVDANGKLRVGQVAARHQGRISNGQLRALGVSRTSVGEWVRAGYLHRRLPGVFAVGHCARTVESDLWEAILYAGPGAALSHGSAAWWRGLIDFPVSPIHVRTPRRRRSLPGIAVHCRRSGVQRTRQRGVPVTPVAETMLDLAAQGELKLVRRSLANLDFADSLHAPAIRAICGRGRAGSAALRWAIDNYEPLFAHTQSPFEDDFILVCERLDIPKPDRIGKRVLGIPCDAIYDVPMVIVELDGIGNHHSPAQIRRDHRNDKTLRDGGWLVLRYTSDQLAQDAEGIRAEIIRELAARRPQARHTRRRLA